MLFVQSPKYPIWKESGVCVQLVSHCVIRHLAPGEAHLCPLKPWGDVEVACKGEMETSVNLGVGLPACLPVCPPSLPSCFLSSSKASHMLGKHVTTELCPRGCVSYWHRWEDRSPDSLLMSKEVIWGMFLTCSVFHETNAASKCLVRWETPVFPLQGQMPSIFPEASFVNRCTGWHLSRMVILSSGPIAIPPPFIEGCWGSISSCLGFISLSGWLP